MAQLSLWDDNTSPTERIINDASPTNVKLRPSQKLRGYQQDAVNAIHDSHRTPGHHAPLVSMATAGGKTTVIAQFMRETINPHKQRALVIAHTEEIVRQLYARIKDQFSGGLNGWFDNRPGIGVVMANENVANARVVVATRQSLHQRRLPKLLEYGHFDLLVIDEAHHALAGNTYGQIIDTLSLANPHLKIVGVTATPQRTDKKALASIFSNICYEWSIKNGIESGYLVPPTRISVGTNVDLSDVNTSRGDYSSKKLMSILDAKNWRELATDAYIQHAYPLHRPTLAFMPSVQMSQAFVGSLRDKGVAAEHIDGTTTKGERRAILRAYLGGVVQVVSNYGVLTEGFDAPNTGIIFMARPTRSRTLFTQIIGRGLRLAPGKKDCIIVDLTVKDTKALQTGTLLGKLVACRGCAVEFYAGMTNCPQCGTLVSAKPSASSSGGGGEAGGASLYIGDGVSMESGSIFEESFAAWFTGEGYHSCTLGSNKGALVVIPPTQDDLYRLVLVPDSDYQPIEVLDFGYESEGLLTAEIESMVKTEGRQLADKTASWRDDPASPGQLRFLKKLGGINTSEPLTKGIVAQIITHKLALRRLANFKFGKEENNGTG